MLVATACRGTRRSMLLYRSPVPSVQTSSDVYLTSSLSLSNVSHFLEQLKLVAVCILVGPQALCSIRAHQCLAAHAL